MKFSDWKEIGKHPVPSKTKLFLLDVQGGDIFCGVWRKTKDGNDFKEQHGKIRKATHFLNPVTGEG